MGPKSMGAFGRVLVITALAATVTGCEGESMLQEQGEESIPGVSDTCDVEVGGAPVHFDGDLGEGPDLFVLSVDGARDGESIDERAERARSGGEGGRTADRAIDVIVDRQRDTVLVLASTEAVRWNVTSTAHVRVITVEGDHDAVERAVIGTNLPLAGFHGCRRSGSFGIYD